MKPSSYQLTPAMGQAVLNFQGRIFPTTMDAIEVQKIEQVRTNKKQRELPEIEQVGTDKKQKELPKNLTTQPFSNLLLQGDCLATCSYLKEKNIAVDLVYIDPPFASGANYAKTIYLRDGKKSSLEAANSIGEEIMYGDIWQKEDYLNWIYERLLAIRSVMSERASIYIHLDWHIGNYVKILLDEVFGEQNFRNEIIWNYGGRGGKAVAEQFPRNHDCIFWYSKNNDFIYNKIFLIEKIKIQEFKKFGLSKDGQGNYFHHAPRGHYTDKSIKHLEKENRIYINSNNTIRIKYFHKHDDKFIYIEKIVSDVWDDIGDAMHFGKQEKTGYNTQKPKALLERIIQASSDEGMVVADFFSGSGTTADVANNLNRKFIACDIGLNAVQTTRDRLIKAKASFDVLRVQDGIKFFRNPAQTKAKLFSLITGFRSASDLKLTTFWDGGIADKDGCYIPVKFVGLQKKLTKELVDFYLAEIYSLAGHIKKATIIYTYKDLEITAKLINDKVYKKSEVVISLQSLDELLAAKKDSLFMADSAVIIMTPQDKGYQVEIKNFFSSYLKNKIKDYNDKKAKNKKLDNPEEHNISVSESGLELIEAVQFDTTMGGVWKSNLELEDKAGPQEKIKGNYFLNTDKFKIKIRNIAGDELIIPSSDLTSKD